jgi:hypothetical protein
MVTFTGALSNSIDDGGIVFRGTKATLKIDRAQLLVYPEGGRWRDGTLYPTPEVHVRSEHDGTIDHVANFLDCMRSRKAPNANIEIGFEAARASWLGNIALKRGLKTEWNESLERVSA